MGLFDGGAKQSAVENMILQSLSQLEILDDIVLTVVENEKEWITKCQGYYDTCQRQVTIGPDLFEIKWVDYEIRDGQKTMVYEDEVRYSYTASGYTPIHNHVNEKGREDVSVGRVVFLWSNIVRERLASKMSDCQFGTVTQSGDYSRFMYSVVPRQYRRWFR